jgi:hypothetical protein
VDVGGAGAGRGGERGASGAERREVNRAAPLGDEIEGEQECGVAEQTERDPRQREAILERDGGNRRGHNHVGEEARTVGYWVTITESGG